MRGTLAKRIRQHVRKKYPFLSDEPLYIERVNGEIRLAQGCKRALSQMMKHNFYKLRRVA